MSSSLTSTFTSPPSTSTQPISHRPLNITQTTQSHRFKVSCTGAPHDHMNNINQLMKPPNVDRRHMLVGLAGSVYTATSLTSIPSAIPAPITTPDITSTCRDMMTSAGVNNNNNNINVKTVRTRKCCPPKYMGKTIKPFVFPNEHSSVRMRWPAHRGTLEQVDKYRRAIQAMRALPEDHPHSFNSQAKIHCAYCNGYYTQIDSGFPDIDIQIHNSWLFFPFHRWYLYFYERILGKLINDPTFALPFWKWDEPAGMRIPEIFVPKEINGKPNPLYDVYRDARHIEAVIDLDYDRIDKDIPDEIQIACNLCTVYRDLVRNGGDTISFFGGKYVAGDSPIANMDPSVGSLEAGSHTAVHRWVGDARMPLFEDLGNFYSAGYDPVFYIHHVNVDRMWKLWKDLGIPGHKDPTDLDWLNASYVFYDENEELVRVYNKDAINLHKFNYDYIQHSQEVFMWRNLITKRTKSSPPVAWARDVKTVEQISFPVQLNKILKVRVRRPGVDRNIDEKAKANEVLLIKRIKFDSRKFVKFDVFVNDKVNEGEVTTTSSCDPEYAGGFAQIPHNDMRNMFVSSSARFGLNELLDDTNTEAEEYVTVTLVPRVGCDNLTIGEIKIELVPIV